MMALLPSDRDGVFCQVNRAYPLGEGDERAMAVAAQAVEGGI